MRKVLVVLAMAALALAALSVAVGAHHPTIEAEVVCTPDSELKVNYTSRSWTKDNEGGQAENSQIVIYVDGVEIGEGAYTPENDFEFSGMAPLPPVPDAEPGEPETRDMVTVRAVAEGEWKQSPSETGNYREVTVPVPPCEEGEDGGDTGGTTGGDTGGTTGGDTGGTTGGDTGGTTGGDTGGAAEDAGEVEVLPSQILPMTGPEDDVLPWAAALVAVGAVLTLASRRQAIAARERDRTRNETV